MKSIIERETTFENNSFIEVKVTQKNHHEHLKKMHNEGRYAQQPSQLDKVQYNTIQYNIFSPLKSTMLIQEATLGASDAERIRE